MRIMMGVLCCSILTLGCADTGVEPGASTLPIPTSVPEAQRLVLGRWEWVESNGWFIGPMITPASIGHTKAMVFAADGIARTYSDGKITMIEHYRFRPGALEYTLMLDSSGHKGDFRISGNYFSWDGRIWDGDYSLYKRTSSWEY
jgi:hypothetical protein